MPRIILRVAVTLVLLTTLSLAGRAAPEALARVEIFQARNHEFEGLRFLSGATVLNAAGIGPEASIWDDFEPWVERLEDHPLVVDARVRRRFPNTLVVTVQERAPVGLVPNPTLEPVDREGRFLPLDPSRFPLDYPVLRPGRLSGEDELSQVQVRELAAAAEIMRQEGEFWSGISEVAPGDHGDLVVRWGSPEVVFRLTTPVEPRRIRAGMAALQHARDRTQGQTPRSVDLRFSDRVFLDWGPGGPP